MNKKKLIEFLFLISLFKVFCRIDIDIVKIGNSKCSNVVSLSSVSLSCNLESKNNQNHSNNNGKCSNNQIQQQEFENSNDNIIGNTNTTYKFKPRIFIKLKKKYK
ncbi:hypothetical protein ACTFIU_010258 [Dictyostelium citrinum]